MTIELREQKTTQWARLLPFVQVKKNRRFHRGIGRSPYEALFGRELMLGNEDKITPTNEERGISDKDEDDEDEGEFIVIDGTDWVTNVNDRFVPLEHADEGSDEEANQNDDSALDETFLERSTLDEREEAIANERQSATTSQKKQAEKMLESSAKRLGILFKIKNDNKFKINLI